ncbi:MAG TPA: amino acid permease [Chitinophagales bacterium]|nr:amino acid permease [Chitinophagales bacterium]
MHVNPTLKRTLGLSTATLLVMSSMIGSGIFKKVAPMSTVLGDSNLVLLAWFAAGLVTVMGTLTYAGLASLTEEAGGQYEYLRIIFGKFFSYLLGWACFAVIQTASIASIAFVFAESVNNLLPMPAFTEHWANINIGGFIFPFANSGVKLLAIITIVILTYINYRGVKEGGLLNDIFSWAKILGIIILIVLGLSYTSATPVLHHAADYVPLTFNQILAPFFLAMLGAFWAYDGWVNVTYITGEIKNPKRNVPIAIIAGTILVMLLYVLINTAYFRVLTVDEFSAIDAAGNQIAGVEVAKKIMGNSGNILISILIMLCTFGATNASLMSSPRIYYRMANAGVFFPGAAKIHPEFKTPHIALLMQMIWAIVLVMSGTFDQLTDMLIFAAFIFYGASAYGLVLMKRKKLITVKVFGYPFVPVFYILFCICLVVNTLITMPKESITGLLLIAAGIPLYFYFNRKKLLP